MPTVSTLDKSLRLLETVFSTQNGIGTRALAQKLGFNAATAHNIARTFCNRGYLQQDPESKVFKPGMSLMKLGRHPSYRSSLTLTAGPTVNRVAEDLKESILLGAIEHGRTTKLLYIPSPLALRVQEPEDTSELSHCTAFGKVLLSSLSPEDLGTYLQQTDRKAYTPRTISHADDLRKELYRVSEQGYARTIDEYEEGISAVAVPIHDPWGQVSASIGASAPTVRMQRPGEFETSLKRLLEAAREIESLWFDSTQGPTPPPPSIKTPQGPA